MRLRISEFVMLCASVHGCMCVGLRDGWLSTSVGKTGIAILEEMDGFLYYRMELEPQAIQQPVRIHCIFGFFNILSHFCLNSLRVRHPISPILQMKLMRLRLVHSSTSHCCKVARPRLKFGLCDSMNMAGFHPVFLSVFCSLLFIVVV